MKLKKWQPIRINWVDSGHQQGWKFEDDIDMNDKLLQYESIGYFFKETGKAVTIVQSKSNDGDEKCMVDSTMTIPKVAITKVKRI